MTTGIAIRQPRTRQDPRTANDMEAEPIPHHHVCSYCDKVVDSVHDCPIGLRFCERDIYGQCVMCRDWVQASSLALEFFNVNSDDLVCEPCAVKCGVGFGLWAAFSRGLLLDSWS